MARNPTAKQREHAEAEARREAERIASTELFSSVAAPELIHIEAGQPWLNGWLFNVAADGGRGWVVEAWSEDSCHGIGRHRSSDRHDRGTPDYEIPASQRRVGLYATRHDALVALRLAMEQRYAKLLADVDTMIEETNDVAFRP